MWFATPAWCSANPSEPPINPRPNTAIFFIASPRSFQSMRKANKKAEVQFLCFPPVYLQTWSFLRNSTGPRLDRRAKIKVPCKNFIQLGSQINIHNGWIVHAISSCCQEQMRANLDMAATFLYTHHKSSL